MHNDHTVMKETEKQPWLQPVLRRLDGADAEGAPGASTDSPITTS